MRPSSKRSCRLFVLVDTLLRNQAGDDEAHTRSGPDAPPSRSGVNPRGSVTGALLGRPAPGMPGRDATLHLNVSPSFRSGVGLRSERGPVLLALMVSTGLIAIDATILATAVPSIVRDVGGFAQFP